MKRAPPVLETPTRAYHSTTTDGTYERVRVHFSEAEIAALTLAIAMINSWNRLNVALRTEAGGYRPGMCSTACVRKRLKRTDCYQRTQ